MGTISRSAPRGTTFPARPTEACRRIAFFTAAARGCSTWAKAQPIGWIDQDHLLVAAVQPHSDDKVAPVIREVGTGRSRRVRRAGNQIGWSGGQIVISHPGYAELFSPRTLARTGTIPLPGYAGQFGLPYLKLLCFTYP